MSKLQEFLLAEMSRRNTDFVVEICRKNPKLFDELFEMVVQNTEPLSRRAIWALDHLTEQEPELMASKIIPLIEAYPNFKHDGLKRHSFRILRRHEIPEEQELVLIDWCFQIINSAKESIALKAHAMDILYEFSNKEPDIKTELAATIELQLHNASTGIKNKSKRMLKKLYLEIKY